MSPRMQHDNASLRNFEKQFERWKLAQFARALPAMVPGNGDSTAIRRHAWIMALVSLAAVVGLGALLLLLVQTALPQPIAAW